MDELATEHLPNENNESPRSLIKWRVRKELSVRKKPSNSPRTLRHSILSRADHFQHPGKFEMRIKSLHTVDRGRIRENLILRHRWTIIEAQLSLIEFAEFTLLWSSKSWSAACGNLGSTLHRVT